MRVDLLPILFGRLLKDCRQKKSISQETLAFSTGLDRTYISLLERGKRQPTLTTIFILVHAFGMTPAELMEKLEKLRCEHENS